MLLKLSQFFPLCQPLPGTLIPSSNPPLSSCQWVMHGSSLVFPFPVLFLTFPCLFCTYQLCFLISAPFPPFSWSSLPADNPPNGFHIYHSVSVLIVCLVCFCFLDSVVDSCVCHFTVHTFDLLFLKLSPFNISYNKDLVMMNSFSFTLSGKHFICPSILNDSFAGWSNLGCRSLLFITLNIS